MSRSACMLALLTVLAGCTGGQTTAPLPVPVPIVYAITNSPTAYYGDYTGPQRTSLLAVRAGGAFDATAQTIVLDAQMASPIFDGNTNYYVWGINRGNATNAPFLHEPNVIFDAVVLVTANPITSALSGVVNLLNGTPPQPISATLLAPNTIEVSVPTGLLPPTKSGLTAAGFVWNLWPRSGVGGSATAQIASFIPQNAMAPFIPR